MKRFIVAWTALLISACGSQPPTIALLPLADEDSSLAPGEHKNFPFEIDLTTMEAPAVIGTLATSSTNETLNLLVLTENNYTLWVANEPYVAYFESGQRTGGNINIPFTGSGRFHIVLSNRSTSFQVAYSFILDLFWTEI